jgi:3-deoxy-7-phosphoheptulonate synthase
MFTKKDPLPSPELIRQELPLEPEEKKFIAKARLQGQMILQRKLPLLSAFVGPCSIHDPESAIEYALRLQQLSNDLQNSLFLVMRLFIEKPRTHLGWKGFLYDPYLDGSNDLAEGIRRSRKLFLTLAKLGVPCACELLDPLIVDYFSDLISWGFIGARTSASPIHRQLASGMPFPVGFKNNLQGDLDAAVSAALSSREPHSHIGLNNSGQICAVKTSGNPWTHIVLRGSNTKPNFDPTSLALATQLLKRNRLPPILIIDCGHGNSGKNYIRQKIVFESAILQAMKTNSPIAGIMLESHLFAGHQPFVENPQHLSYGVSITDSCLGWEETEELLRWAGAGCSLINSVQK